MKKKEKKGIFEGKSKWIIISSIIFVILGIALIIIGFGFTYGWKSIIMWFASRMAMYLYIGIGLLAFLVAWIIFKIKIGD